MNVSVFAKSSSGEPYAVDFDDSTGALRIFCRCQAGIRQLVCKHKVGLALGDKSFLHSERDFLILDEIISSPAYPHLNAAAVAYANEISEIEKQVSSLKKREKSLKEAFSHLLHHTK